MFDLRQLQIFSKVAKLKSFSAGSQELFLSQSTVSTRIKCLEEIVGMPLFLRNTSTIELTDAGKLLLQYAEQILAISANAEEAIKNYKQGINGTLILATTPSICNYVLPKLIKDFYRRHKDINIVLHAIFGEEIISMVQAGKVDVGVIRDSRANFKIPKLRIIPIDMAEVHFIAQPNHPIFRKKEILLSDLAVGQLLAYSVSSNYWRQIQTVFDNAGLHLETKMELNDISAIKTIAALGLGIAVFPSITFQEELDKGTLKIIPVQNCPSMKRYTYVLYRESSIPFGPVHVFINDLLQRKKPLNWDVERLNRSSL
jgi:DNA-binding transcriptional LysR family regulator